MNIRTIDWKNNKVRIIDQTKLPQKLVYVDIDKMEGLGRAIKTMQVRLCCPLDCLLQRCVRFVGTGFHEAFFESSGCVKTHAVVFWRKPVLSNHFF